MNRSRTSGGADPILLLEIVLVLVLFALAVVLYWIPSQNEPFVPAWWTPVLLGGLFFGILILDVYRRRRTRRTELHEGIREEARREAAREPRVPPEG